MRRFVFPALLLSFATPAFAETDYSAEIAAKGLTATEARLAALPAPDDTDRFALGGVRFLRAMERVLQTRWQTGMSETLSGTLPVFRLPIPENPSPAPFDPALITNAFRDLSSGMDTARAPLVAIADGSEFGVTIRLDDLWFDINANAARDAGEGVGEVAGPMIMGWAWSERPSGAPLPVIRFDAADAAWLSAYAHLLAGIGDTVVAYDPTDGIAKVLATRQALQYQPADPGSFDMDDSIQQFLDLVLAISEALDQPPDAARLTSARDHFLSMVADNRVFWSRVAAETDNSGEWLPGGSQTSALGIVLPPETGTVWLGVLTDIEALLKGDLLAPYWRLDGQASGINVARLFTEPAPVDLMEWIQGAGALPYIEQGRVMQGESWSRFEGMMGGEAMLMTLFLN